MNLISTIYHDSVGFVYRLGSTPTRYIETNLKSVHWFLRSVHLSCTMWVLDSLSYINFNTSPCSTRRKEINREVKIATCTATCTCDVIVREEESHLAVVNV